MTSSPAPVTVRPVHEDDRDVWADLFAQYRAFYELEPDAAVVDRVWGWLFDPDHEVFGLVAVADGRVVGIAHARRFSRTSRGLTGLWLDDLFTSPDGRGHGVGRALITALQEQATAEGLGLVRWITAEDNTPARALYDTLASATSWVTYDAPPA
jgi:GNAT superfamily N-acetyltransferase